MAVKKYYCKWQGCKEILERPGYCAKHKVKVAEREKHWAEKRAEHFQKAKRTNYSFYRTKRWRLLRAEVIKAMPFCFICGSTEKLHVDHIRPPRGDADLFFDRYNLQVMCESCHRKKTAQEIQSRKKNKKNIDEVKGWLSQYVKE